MAMLTDLLERAIALSATAVERKAGGPFGAVIARDGQVIAVGHNQVIADRDPTAHAEVVAIRAACQQLSTFRLEGCELYTSCEPCPMCLGAIYWARIARVYYANTRQEAAEIGFDDAFLYEEFSLPVGERSIEFTRVELASAAAPLRAWLEHPDRRLY